MVKLGKLLHKSTFKRDNKEIQIGPIAIDLIRKGKTIEIREVKKSDVFEEAHKFQTLYYLYFLEKLGVEGKAIISFPKQRKNVRLELDRSHRDSLDKILQEISKILKGEMPKPSYKKFCRKCSYFEFCFT
jgi:CRISPR-associated exonuclease Cas4